MTSTTVGREIVQIVEVKQPFCELTYGVAPCTASGTADQKCYNTRKTCQDAANFDLGSLSLFFSTGDAASRDVSGATYILPFLASVSTVPTKINLAGSNPDAKGIGTRELVSITMIDSQHTDERVDPYLSGRSWNPLDKERGTFWTRWMARNPYRQNIEVVIYEGYAGQALADMTKRTYFLDSIQGPRNGTVTLKCKDILARAEERKAQAPAASPGLLFTGIGAADASFTVANAVEADYSATGYVRIGDEIIQYSARAASGDNVAFTVAGRAVFGTSAAAHAFDTAVQQVLFYDDERAVDVVEDLLTTYAGIDASWLDFTNWEADFDTFMPSFRVTAVIAEPESVVELISQLCEQVGFYIWWDARESLVKWRGIRGVEEQPPLITDSVNILADSFSLTEYPRERISQVWIYYGRNNYVREVDDVSAYANQFVLANLEAETDELYGEAQVRKIFARWLQTAALAQTTASKILVRYVETPSKCTFDLDAKDREYWVGDTIRISHWMDRDEFGERRIRRWTITAAEEVAAGHTIRYTAEDTTLYGEINYIMASGAADYNPAGGNPVKNCFIGDANGLLSDGTNCGRVA